MFLHLNQHAKTKERRDTADRKCIISYFVNFQHEIKHQIMASTLTDLDYDVFLVSTD